MTTRVKTLAMEHFAVFWGYSDPENIWIEVAPHDYDNPSTALFIDHDEAKQLVAALTHALENRQSTEPSDA